MCGCNCDHICGYLPVGEQLPIKTSKPEMGFDEASLYYLWFCPAYTQKRERVSNVLIGGRLIN